MRRIAIAALALAVAALWWRRERSAPPPVAGAADLPAAVVREPVAPVLAAAPAVVAVAADLRPPSLRGTAVDGDLVLDARGDLVATADAIRLFDYFLTTLGEVDLAGVRALVAAEARRRVPGREDQALALFDRYVGYLDDARAAAQQHAPGDGVHPLTAAREQLDRLEELQRARFGDDAARVFGDDNTLARAILDRSEVEGREDLSPADRRARLEAIEAQLPPAVREARARMRAPAEARAEVEALRRRGASAEEIRALRVRYFGEEAADRLEELDRQRGD